MTGQLSKSVECMHGIIGLGTRCFDGSKGASYHVCSERLLDVRLGRGGDANLIPH